MGVYFPRLLHPRPPLRWKGEPEDWGMLLEELLFKMLVLGIELLLLFLPDKVLGSVNLWFAVLKMTDVDRVGKKTAA